MEQVEERLVSHSDLPLTVLWDRITWDRSDTVLGEVIGNTL